MFPRRLRLILLPIAASVPLSLGAGSATFAPAPAVGSAHAASAAKSPYRCAPKWQLTRRGKAGYVCMRGRAKRRPTCRVGYARELLRGKAVLCRPPQAAAPAAPTIPQAEPQVAATPAPPVLPTVAPAPPPAPVTSPGPPPRNTQAQLDYNLSEARAFAEDVVECAYGSVYGNAWSACVLTATVEPASCRILDSETSRCDVITTSRFGAETPLGTSRVTRSA